MAKQAFRLAACAVAVIAASVLGGCGEQSSGGGGQTVRVDGSSTVFPLSEAIAEAFHGVGGQASVGESGTGGGFSRFCRGEIDVANASRPILTAEMEACAAAGITYVEVPVAFDGITVVVHPSNPVTSATMAELRKMWEPAAQGVITNWRQVNPAWPDLELALFGAGTDSGTFDFFTEAVMGEEDVSRSDYTPTEDDNVTVQGVSGNRGAVGYFGMAYFDHNRERLNALSIDSGAGPVTPSLETVASGEYALARPLIVYFNADSLRRPTVQQFAQFYLANASRLAPEVGYVPLPDAAYEAYGERVRMRVTGTAFGGHQEVGAGIDEVLARPLEDGGATDAAE